VIAAADKRDRDPGRSTVDVHDSQLLSVVQINASASWIVARGAFSRRQATLERTELEAMRRVSIVDSGPIRNPMSSLTSRIAQSALLG